VLLSQIAHAVGAQFSDDGSLEKDISISRVSTDTRTLESGDLFVAIKGPSFNGHSYLSDAYEKGCIAAIVEEKKAHLDIPQLVVKDTRIALGLMAEAWRKQFSDLKVVAVTGSCGKTTVKEMLAAILNEVAPTLATQGNFNNDFGVPLTLLRLNSSHRFAVLELGANAMGEIAYTSKLVHPDVALITNAAAVHVEGFGSVSNVAREKAEIYKSLSASGVAVVNADDSNSKLWLDQIGQAGNKVLVCSENILSENEISTANLWLENIVPLDLGGYRYDVCSKADRITIRSALLGFHNVMNALLAIAAAKSLGVTDQAIQAGLEKVQAPPGRLNVYSETALNVLLIDDTYNASPHSVNAAIQILSNYTNEKVLILGNMAELGEKAEEYHHQVGQQAKEEGIDKLLVTGLHAKAVVAGFGDQGICFESQQALINALPNYLDSGMTVLVKGSRSSHMEKVVNAIKEKTA
jgi:UDP-N-acetylmuramoyl-tripeptide--D-alanyl-D-alanine ligase